MTHPAPPDLTWRPPWPWIQLPALTAGVAQPVVSLNGAWKFHPRPPAGFWKPQVSKDAWRAWRVPGCTFARGWELAEGAEYAFHTDVAVPADFAGQRVFLRFDGVTGQARVWIDGQFARGHYGGFTTWYCEITDRVTAGQAFGLTVGVTDVPSELSGFNLGGIIRDVHMAAVPPICFHRVHVDCRVPADLRAAEVKVQVEVTPHADQDVQLRAELRDPTGARVALDEAAWDPALRGQTRVARTLSLAEPALWDAEHPRLYDLELRLESPQGILEAVHQRFGVRRLEVQGQKLLVNGRAVKLRGVNRHDAHPATGRTVTPEQVATDVRLLRDANVNFIRTSHYPPREDLLERCDEYGLYVEDETAVAFVYQAIRPTQNDPAFTAAYMDQFAEMIERDRNHPCVILWSLANECYWGSNFRHAHAYARQADPSRPVIFSYPNTMPEGTPPCDVWSLHYADWDQDPSRQTDTWSGFGLDVGAVPVLHDEYAHIACYNLAEQRRDPGVRTFWGESIKRWWESLFAAEGALGGAIWGGIDDEMISAAGYTGQREWGIIDGWRRRKPEYWLTKKAYSPVRVADWTLPPPLAGGEVQVPIANWFDHTNLAELTVEWRAGDAAGRMPGPDLAPHAQGALTLPAAAGNGQAVTLRFVRQPDIVVDEFVLTPAGRAALPAVFRAATAQAPALRVEEARLTVRHPEFTAVIARATGMMSVVCQGETLVASGPHLHWVGLPLPPWKAASVEGRQLGDKVRVTIAGAYGDIEAAFQLQFDPAGIMEVAYRILKLPYPNPRARGLRAGRDIGGLREIGVAFELSPQVDRLSWERRGLWSVFPDDHIGRNRGTAWRERAGGDESFGREPTWPWHLDMRNYSLYGRYDVGGRGTKDFRAMRHHIRFATAHLADSSARFSALSRDGTESVRLEVLPPPGSVIPVSHPDVRLAGTWLPGEPGSEREWISGHAGDYAQFSFEGDGFGWLGAKDLIYGKANVYLDGVYQATVDLYADVGHGAARGEVKARDEILFSREGLPRGRHTVKIEVLGARHPASSNSYVSLSGFRVLGRRAPGNVLFHILNEWNYPELTWGNYMKEPIRIHAGYAQRVQVRMHGS